MEIDGKVALVTGAGSGIGRASALALAREGAAVVVADMAEGAGRETVGLLEEAGGKAAFVLGDVSDPVQLTAIFAAAAEAFGGLDIVHNNAGIVCGEPLWPGTDPARLFRQVAVNLGAVVVGTRLAVDHLGPRGGGAVVNTASLAAVFPLEAEPAYSATKAGVVMFTQACAGLEQSHGIRVTAVLPALVDTPLLDKTGDGVAPADWVGMAKGILGLQSPDDVAAVVVDLVRQGTAGEHRFVEALPTVLGDAAPG
jgi:NAD(P)-dependent dehydrogenase (short-subunit alcohol dehydrogenase family)